MTTPIANLWFLRHLVGFLQVDEAIDPNEEGEVKAFFGRVLSPQAALLSAGTMDRVSVALRYYVQQRPESLSNVLEEAQELPFASPSSPPSFFRWMWDTLFPKGEWKPLAADCAEVDEQSTARLLFDPEAPLTEWQRRFADTE